MNDREFNEQKQRIKALVKKWVQPSGLGWWKIDILYCRENEIALTNGHDPGSAFVSLMDCECQWQYLTAGIRINMPILATLDDEEAERAFVHELMHLFVAEMRPDEPTLEQHNHEERVVTTLANAMLWIRRAGHSEGKRDRPNETAA